MSEWQSADVWCREYDKAVEREFARNKRLYFIEYLMQQVYTGGSREEID